jgi:hypothetical protein
MDLSSSIAHECECEDIAVAVESPETFTGVSLFIVLLSPSWPRELDPQHCADPLARTAQVLPLPAEISVAVDIPETVTGVSLLIVLLSPSWPRELDPQHLMEPLAKRAQV